LHDHRHGLQVGVVREWRLERGHGKATVMMMMMMMMMMMVMMMMMMMMMLLLLLLLMMMMIMIMMNDQVTSPDVLAIEPSPLPSDILHARLLSTYHPQPVSPGKDDHARIIRPRSVTSRSPLNPGQTPTARVS
jgi:hypothetical protein